MRLPSTRSSAFTWTTRGLWCVRFWSCFGDRSPTGGPGFLRAQRSRQHASRPCAAGCIARGEPHADVEDQHLGVRLRTVTSLGALALFDDAGRGTSEVVPSVSQSIRHKGEQRAFVVYARMGAHEEGYNGDLRELVSDTQVVSPQEILDASP